MCTNETAGEVHFVGCGVANDVSMCRPLVFDAPLTVDRHAPPDHNTIVYMHACFQHNLIHNVVKVRAALPPRATSRVPRIAVGMGMIMWPMRVVGRGGCGGGRRLGEHGSAAVHTTVRAIAQTGWAVPRGDISTGWGRAEYEKKSEDRIDREACMH